jgi:alkylhydroperoxidase/carboxymuconolactone decarboxylase family protein YurZ
LRNGVTADEISEILLHAAIYCGLPAADKAFHIALEVLRDGGKE